MSRPPNRQVRAVFDDATVTVYQAYPPAIAGPALAAGRFVPPFKSDRMTWVKPSFLWMMYRCGWARKPDQEVVLAVRMTRAGFDEALAEGCLSHFDPAVHADRDTWHRQTRLSPVRVQWDPERDLSLAPQPWRAIQVGLAGPASRAYVERWVVGIEDVTPLARRVEAEVVAGRPQDEVARLLPVERAYPLAAATRARLGADG